MTDHTAIYDPASVPFSLIGAQSMTLGIILKIINTAEVVFDWDPSTNTFDYFL
ncbi:hypothetical protein ACP5PY_24545 [Photobacterium leiognathi subsp. mandapamensis]